MSVESVAGFGSYNFSVSEVVRPHTVDELASALTRLRAEGKPVIFRGGGRSYGDAAINPDGPVVDLRGLDRVLGVDEATGVIRLEPGVTYEGLWKAAIPRGLWPPVVPGTMFGTLGGSVAMNIHGKNGWKAGTLGDHLEYLTVLDRSFRPRTIRREDPEMLEVVSRYGAEEPIVEIGLHLKKVPSGYLTVEGIATANLRETLEVIDRSKETHEYVVGWIDCFPGGAGAGRGEIHVANPDTSPDVAGKGFSVEEQVKELRGLVPKSVLLLGLKSMTHDPGMRFVNAAKWLVHRLQGHTRYRQSYVAFSFLLDFIPGWQNVYQPHGFIQYQLFLPKETALDGFTRALAFQRELGVYSYLGVVKRHRPDRFRNRYAPDGYSLALDFPVTPARSSRLIELCRRYDALLHDLGGANYKAKDCVGSLPHRAA